MHKLVAECMGKASREEAQRNASGLESDVAEDRKRDICQFFGIRIEQLMGKNFLISYSGRVGSTALIDSLKLFPRFHIPIFEEFDAWHVEQNNLSSEYRFDNMHEHVARIFGEKIGNIGMKDVSIGFKWRIWGKIDKIGNIIKDNNVIVFNLLRSDLFEFICSLYLTNIIYKEYNSVQFLLKDATTNEEREKILFRYRLQKHDINIDQFFGLMKDQIEIEKNRISLIIELQKLGCEVYTIFYEDFSYKKFRFFSKFLDCLGHPKLSFLPIPKISKVSNPHPSEQFNNRDSILSKPELVEILHYWDNIVYQPGLKRLNM